MRKDKTELFKTRSFSGLKDLVIDSTQEKKIKKITSRNMELLSKFLDAKLLSDYRCHNPK